MARYDKLKALEKVNHKKIHEKKIDNTAPAPYES